MNLLLALTLLSPAAHACFDPSARPISEPYAFLRGLEHDNASAAACLRKLDRVGMDLHQTAAWRKEHAAGDNGPVVYSILVQGRDGAGRIAKLRMDYNLRKHAFVCGAVDYRITRGCF